MKPVYRARDSLSTLWCCRGQKASYQVSGSMAYIIILQSEGFFPSYIYDCVHSHDHGHTGTVYAVIGTLSLCHRRCVHKHSHQPHWHYVQRQWHTVTRPFCAQSQPLFHSATLSTLSHWETVSPSLCAQSLSLCHAGTLYTVTVTVTFTTQKAFFISI